MKNSLKEFKEHLIEIREELGKLDKEDIELCYEGCFADKISLLVEAPVGKNLAGENKEGLTEWRTILLNEKHHTLLKHILETGIKDGWLGNKETKKLLRIITTAEKMDYYVGRKLTKAKLDKLTKFLQEQY